MWGTPAVDMFATVHNTHLPQFMSPVQEPRALAIDALSQDLQGRSMYMFPLFSLLSTVTQKLGTTQEGEVILIPPCWPSQPWFPHLCLKRQVVPSALMEALVQHCMCTKQQDFQKRSLDSQQLLEDPIPIECMTTGGYTLLTVVRQNRGGTWK